MKKLIMMAVMSGMVFGCFGCFPGDKCHESHYLKSQGTDVFVQVHSCTGSWRATLLELVTFYYSRIDFVKELLAAGARDYNFEAYKYSMEHGHTEIAQLIKNSEAQHKAAYDYAIEHGVTYENFFANGPTGMPNPTTPERDPSNDSATW